MIRRRSEAAAPYNCKKSVYCIPIGSSRGLRAAVTFRNRNTPLRQRLHTATSNRSKLVKVSACLQPLGCHDSPRYSAYSRGSLDRRSATTGPPPAHRVEYGTSRSATGGL